MIDPDPNWLRVFRGFKQKETPQNFEYVATMETSQLQGVGTEPREERKWEKRKTNIKPFFSFTSFLSKAVFKLIYLQPVAAA